MAYAGLIEEKYVSWLPSYGPGNARRYGQLFRCLSDEPIGSPLVLNPDVLIAMNLPSYDRFIDQVAPGGIAVIDSSLIAKRSDRTDIRCFMSRRLKRRTRRAFPASSNNILLGKALQGSARFASLEAVEWAVAKCVPPKKQHLWSQIFARSKLGMSL